MHVVTLIHPSNYERAARSLVGGLDGELEDDLLAAESAVDGREGVELVLEEVLVLGVKVGLAELGTVLGNAGAAAGDLGGEDEVVEGGVLDGRESARTGALLAELGVRLARLLGEDTALADENDVLVGELLLELTGEAVISNFEVARDVKSRWNGRSFMFSRGLKLRCCRYE